MKQALKIILIVLGVMIVSLVGKAIDQENQARSIAVSENYQKFWRKSAEMMQPNFTKRMDQVINKFEDVSDECKNKNSGKLKQAISDMILHEILLEPQRENFIETAVRDLTLYDILTLRIFMQSMVEHGDARDAVFFNEESKLRVIGFFESFLQKHLKTMLTDKLINDLALQKELKSILLDGCNAAEVAK